MATSSHKGLMYWRKENLEWVFVDFGDYDGELPPWLDDNERMGPETDFLFSWMGYNYLIFGLTSPEKEDRVDMYGPLTEMEQTMLRDAIKKNGGKVLCPNAFWRVELLNLRTRDYIDLQWKVTQEGAYALARATDGI